MNELLKAIRTGSPVGRAIMLAAILAPVMQFPELLPATWQIPVSVVALALSCAAAATLLAPWSLGIRLSLAILLGAVVVSWGIHTPSELRGVRHLLGLGFGTLVMAIVARVALYDWGLRLAAWGGTLLGLLVAIAGLAFTSVTSAKLVIVAVPMVSEPLYPWLPQIKSGLPGLDATGYLNPNALGGTTLFIWPTAAAAWIAARRHLSSRPLQWLAGVTVILAIAALMLTRSRSAILASGVMLILVAFGWRKSRATILVSLALACTAAVTVAVWSSRTADSLFQSGVRVAENTWRARVGIWNDAARQIGESPWLGVGISQFSEVTPTEANFQTTEVVHAHNVFLQVGLDSGLVGLAAYGCFLFLILRAGYAASSPHSLRGLMCAGASLAIVGVHMFGLFDSISLGAKVGVFFWASAGIILASGGFTYSRRRSDGSHPPDSGEHSQQPFDAIPRTPEEKKTHSEV